MKKILLSVLSLSQVLCVAAQEKVQGQPYDFSKAPANFVFRNRLAEPRNGFTVNDVTNWTGEGSKSALLALQWNNGIETSSLVWGYRWNGDASGDDMLRAVAEADPRLSLMIEEGGPWGPVIKGIGYDANDNGVFALTKNGKTYSPGADGLIRVDDTTFDSFDLTDSEDYWQCGWDTDYWSYFVKTPGTTDWGYVEVGASERILTDGCWDGWNFALGWESQPWLPYAAAAPVKTNQEDPEAIYWIGEGANQATVTISWKDGKAPSSMVWGYRWEENAPTMDALLQEIVSVDPRLFSVSRTGETVSVDGIGYDLNGRNTIAMYVNEDTTYPKYSENGVFTATPSNFNGWMPMDTEDHWNAPAKDSNLGWNCYIRNVASGWDKIQNQGVTRQVAANDHINWVFDADTWTQWKDVASYVSVTPYEKRVHDYTQGIFFVNEDWGGHDNGTVNFMTSDYEMAYRVYRYENPGEALGVTTQFGTIYGDNAYFVSKQINSSDPAMKGGRLVVADAVTLKKKAVVETFESGDGRSFLGVDGHTGYVGTSAGIYLFDIDNLAMGLRIEGTESEYNGQIGSMVRVGDYVFAIKQSEGIIVIDANTHRFKQSLGYSAAATLTLAKDGSVWATVANTGTLIKVDALTLETTEITCPSGIRFSSLWGAWNAGDLCASAHENVLYFATGGSWSLKTVVKYDIDNDTFDTDFFTLPGQDLKDPQILYGAGMRVDHATNNLILTSTESGYGAHYMKNWIHIVDGVSGELLQTVTPENYYWFTAVPMFPDRMAPQVTLENEIRLDETETLSVLLSDVLSDEDNMDAAIVATVVSGNEGVVRASVNYPHLTIQAVANGSTTVHLTATSNGKSTTKEIDLRVGVADGIHSSGIEAGVKAYPVPARDYVNIDAPAGSDILILDLSGRTVRSWVQSDMTQRVALDALTPGIYTVVIKNQRDCYSLRIVKE